MIVILCIFYAAIMWFIIIKLSKIIFVFHFHLLSALIIAFTCLCFCFQIHCSSIVCLAFLLPIMNFLLIFEAYSGISYVHFMFRPAFFLIFRFFLRILPLFMPLSPLILKFEKSNSPIFLYWS